MKKLFAIGDIHGCASKLSNILDKIRIDTEHDTLVFIGDYIDRGPDSREVIDIVLDVKRRMTNVVCLIGNHEHMLINYYLHGTGEEMFFMNGGDITAHDYGLKRTDQHVNMNIPDEHLDFYRSLLPYYETDQFIFVHAGLRPGIPLSGQHMDDIIWIRNEFIDSTYNFGKKVVFGHTPLAKPLIELNKIGIDTGAVYGGKLTCIELMEMRIEQI
jgi:serine/threonine protein phosphatase 1